MKKHIKNTVKGTRRGSKWPPEVKTEALAMMLTANNISDVARRLHMVAGRVGVPESTLRSWYHEALKSGEDGKESIFAAAQREAVRSITQEAARGALLTTRMMVQRAECAGEHAQRAEELRARLIALGPVSDGEPQSEKEERVQMMHELALLNGMTDSAMQRFARELYRMGTVAAEHTAQPATYEAMLQSVAGDEF